MNSIEQHEIAPWPNQKVVFTKKQPRNKKDHYATINYDALSYAMQTLCVGCKTSAPFVLWCYLAKNKPETPFYMSNRGFTKFTGMSKKSYDNAVKILMEKGFIVKKEGRAYTFYEMGKPK